MDGNTKPKIFIVVTARYPEGDVVGGSLAEDGHGLGGHFSSSRRFLRHDMGLTSDWHHDDYREHYPDGYELVDLIDCEDATVIPEFASAMARNKALAAAGAFEKPGEGAESSAGVPR